MIPYPSDLLEPETDHSTIETEYVVYAALGVLSVELTDGEARAPSGNPMTADDLAKSSETRAFTPDFVGVQVALAPAPVQRVPGNVELPQGQQGVTASMGEQISNAVAINEEHPAPLAP